MAEQKPANKKKRLKILLVIFLIIIVLVLAYFMGFTAKIKDLIIPSVEEPLVLPKSKLDVDFKRDFPLDLNVLREAAALPVEAGQLGKDNPFSSL